MKGTFEYNLLDGRRVRIIAEYICKMEQGTIYADGWNIPGQHKPSTYGSKMEAYVDGKKVDSSLDPSFWRLINVHDHPGFRKIWGLKVAFANPADAERYEVWLKELMDAGTSDEVKAVRRAEEDKAAEEAAARKAEADTAAAKKAEAIAAVESIHTEEHPTGDEGGKTVEYIHTITAKSGRTYMYRDRNVFDFGRVINPLYSIDEHDGCIAVRDEGVMTWMNLTKSGWVPVRPLNEDELAAFKVLSYIGHANYGIRM